MDLYADFHFILTGYQGSIDDRLCNLQNKSAQSNLGTELRRCECLRRGGLWLASMHSRTAVRPCAVGSAPWRSFMNMHVTACYGGNFAACVRFVVEQSLLFC